MKATIRNVDAGGVAVGFQSHGDNRGPRPMRWRFEVRSSDGAVMPILLDAPNFGGMSSYGLLQHGKTFEITLDMNEFVHRLPAGEYRVVVKYHDSSQISRMTEVEHLIVARSKPVKLVVEK